MSAAPKPTQQISSNNNNNQQQQMFNVSKKTILRRMANTLGGDVPLSAVPRPVTSNPLLRKDWDNAAQVSEPPVWLKPSSSPHRKPSIYFSREPVTKENAPKGAICVPASALGRAVPLFKVTSQTCEYFALRLPLLKAGFKRIADAESAIDANIMWGKSWPVGPAARKKFLVQNFTSSSGQQQNAASANGGDTSGTDGLFKRPIHRFQKVNHFSGSHKNLGCKSGMARNLQRLAEQYEERRLEHEEENHEHENEDSSSTHNNNNDNNPLTDFIPKTYRLPEQARELKEALWKSDPEKPWIVKPSRGSCGRGVRVFKKGDIEVDQLINWALGTPPPAIKNNNNENDDSNASSSSSTPSSSNPSSPTTTTQQPTAIQQQFAATGRFPLHVIQEYLRRPLLINGRKFDFRVYVCVTSYDPLVAYIHHSGLVRFAAKQYDKTEKDITDVYSHLTNYSVGRKLEAEGKEALKEKTNNNNSSSNNNNEDSSSTSTNRTNPAILAKNMSQDAASTFSLELKWSMEKFNHYLETTYGGKEACDKVWTDIEDVVVKTLFAVQPQIYRSSVLLEANHDASVELYGFDVMLDEDLKPWLIEVNTLPSLESSSAFDYNVKSNVVTDILNLSQLQLYDRSPEVFTQFGLDEEAIREPSSNFANNNNNNSTPSNSNKKSNNNNKNNNNNNNNSSSYYHKLSDIFDPQAKLPKSNAAAATSFVGKSLPPHQDTIDTVCRVRDEVSLMGGFRLMFPTPGKIQRLGKMCVPALAGSPRTAALWKEVSETDPEYFVQANKLNFPKLEGAVATLQPDNDDDEDGNNNNNEGDD